MTIASSDGEPLAERHARLTGQAIGGGFIARYILALVGIWLALQTPASVTLAVRVGQLAPDHKGAALALVASAGAAAALFSNPIFGILSDRSRSRWGKRRPFIAGGMLCGCLSVIGLGFAPTVPWAVAGWVAAQLSFNAAVASLIAILPERVPVRLRGRVSGLMGVTPQIGIVGGTFLIQIVGTQGAGMFVWPSVIGVLVTLPFVLALREAPPAETDPVPNQRATAVRPRNFSFNLFAHRDYTLAWLGRFFVWLGLYQLTTYKTYFLIDRLGFTTETVIPVLTKAMFILAACIVVSSVPGGWLSDRLERRKPFVVFASMLFVVAMLIVAYATTVPAFFVGIAVSGFAMGLYLAVDYALVSQVLPNARDEAAMGMGVFNLSATIPQTMAPALAPLLLSIGASGSTGNYTSLYLVAAGFALIGATITQFIRER
ncbi:MFS transporter [Sphingomonas sp. CFBP 13733]|uniref:MFS transporter n=1 Tax=Sphingomonas sp. CFBP 13733 TaxID=2775291 RepID=UPI00177C9F11|nr:MFS transporter [Sphingomonas sp. CFBP 13733]MBD8641566.1 MFS transporter [Sphingomonas sp. CFBP 13733]